MVIVFCFEIQDREGNFLARIEYTVYLSVQFAMLGPSYEKFVGTIIWHGVTYVRL